mgnify:CR=1 FL=1
MIFSLGKKVSGLERHLKQMIGPFTFFIYAFFAGAFILHPPPLCAMNCASCGLCAPLLAVLPLTLVTFVRRKIRRL